MYHLDNAYMHVAVSPQGAELQSLFLKQNAREYLWQGDARYWKRRAPVLFPIVGKLQNGQYRYRGQVYSLGQHGFARDLPFTLTEQSEQRLAFTLSDTAQTRAVYPFTFVLTICYTLSENRLQVSWQLHNPGDETLRYAIGAHPAFNLPLPASDESQACRVRIDSAGISRLGFRNGWLDPTSQDNAPLTDFSLQQADFAGSDTLIYHTPQTTAVTLSLPDNRHGVRIDYSGLPYLGIWPPPGEAPFLCLEPWDGITDTYDSSGEFCEKFALRQLAAGAVRSYSYTITLY